MTDWKSSYEEKPENYKVVHAITYVGRELEVVEAWWTGEKWVVSSVFSDIPSDNILYWRCKPKIPQEIIDKIKQ